jgi:hypothetical protein
MVPIQFFTSQKPLFCSISAIFAHFSAVLGGKMAAILRTCDPAVAGGSVAGLEALVAGVAVAHYGQCRVFFFFFCKKTL